MSWELYLKTITKHTIIKAIFYISRLKTGSIGLLLLWDLMRIISIIHNENTGGGIMTQNCHRKNVKNCSKKCSSHIDRYGGMIVFVQIPTVSTRSTHRLRIR